MKMGKHTKHDILRCRTRVRGPHDRVMAEDPAAKRSDLVPRPGIGALPDNSLDGLLKKRRT